MAMNSGIFKGSIGGKTIYDYDFKLDYNIKDLDNRMKKVKELLNLDEIGSKDEFWQEIWDIASCKSNISTKDATWSEGNVSQVLERIGTYLIAIDESEENTERKRFSRPKKETDMDSEYSTEVHDISKNDKNYRLDPPEKIEDCDYSLRKVFSKDYAYYKDFLYVKYIDNLKKKIVKDAIERYGYHDGSFDNFSCGELMSEETWNNIRRLEEQKIMLLKDARDNLNILRSQHKTIQNGGFIYNKGSYDKGFNFKKTKVEYKLKKGLYVPNYINETVENIDIYTHDSMYNIMNTCGQQLEMSGYNNKELKEIEEKHLYKTRKKELKLTMSTVNSNIANINDYMIMCKLAYNNRVPLDAGKSSSKIGIMDYVDYSNPYHIEAILYMNCEEITYESDMSIIAYDITKAIRELKEEDKLDSKDMYIIDGIRHNVTQEKLSNELNINVRTVYRRMDKIIEKTVDKLESMKKVS